MNLLGIERNGLKKELGSLALTDLAVATRQTGVEPLSLFSFALNPKMSSTAIVYYHCSTPLFQVSLRATALLF